MKKCEKLKTGMRKKTKNIDVIAMPLDRWLVGWLPRIYSFRLFSAPWCSIFRLFFHNKTQHFSHFSLFCLFPEAPVGSCAPSPRWSSYHRVTMCTPTRSPKYPLALYIYICHNYVHLYWIFNHDDDKCPLMHQRRWHLLDRHSLVGSHDINSTHASSVHVFEIIALPSRLCRLHESEVPKGSHCVLLSLT